MSRETSNERSWSRSLSSLGIKQPNESILRISTISAWYDCSILVFVSINGGVLCAHDSAWTLVVAGKNLAFDPD